MKKTGLVLEGGAVRGVFTAGALDFLMEREVYLPYVIGVSAGACNAVDYVSRQIGRTRDCMIPENKKDSYMGLQAFLRSRTLYDMDLIFDKYPRELFPFDFETYKNSPIRCEMAVTNCLTGKAEYLDDREDMERLLLICRASSSMPVVLADSVPISRMLRAGYKKAVVILTRNAGYRKKLSKKGVVIYKKMYGKRYPELYRAICRRPLIYNRTMELVERLEKEGRIFVLRPETPVISRTERRPEVLKAFYSHGCEMMERRYKELLSYLEQ